MPGETQAFYATIPVFTSFASLTEPSLYQALPEDWLIGLADVVESTKAIEAGRYKVVNMAGAAVIAAVTNALDGLDIPFAFGGDGASFAVAPGEAERAQAALAATAAFVRDDFGLSLRIGLVPVAAIRAEGLDVRIARYQPAPGVAYAMFSGGGLAFAERALKEGRFALTPSPPGTRPDLAGLSCRWDEVPSTRGVVLSLVILPASGMDDPDFLACVQDLLAFVEASGEAAGRPLPDQGPPLSWPPPGLDLEAMTSRRSGEPAWRQRLRLLAHTLGSYLVFRLNLPLGRFVPATYRRELVENSDFRKYDDGLRMTLDCTPAVADAIEDRLKAAEARGHVRYGLHRQGAALVTCITPSVTTSNHVHFVDGAAGGYASAAQRLKPVSARAEET